MSSPVPEGARAAPGSFRDPQGQVFELGQRVYRALYAPLAPFPATWADGGPLAEFIAAGKLWPARPLTKDESPAELVAAAPGAVGFLEHPRLAAITFPYEWPFELLKRAALLHLGFHRALLARGLTLSDGYAYNVQFVGSRPVFIDALAIVPYVEGQPWAGYAQFCESFLNPLLLASRGCETWQALYRGNLRGVPTRETARQLGVWGAIRAGSFLHVTLNSQSTAGPAGAGARRPKFTRAGLDLLLGSLERCIRKLQLPLTRAAHWGDYESDNSYSARQREMKHAAIQDFVRRTKPALVLDIGCNAGEYSQIAIEAGAKSAIGFERDGPAVNRAVLRADALNETFLPLQIDIQNPSPAQGWALTERRSLAERLRPDAVLCLALIHHLVLTEAVPLDRVVAGIVALAPRGIIEFVPPDDPMSQRLTGTPGRITHRYDLPTFMSTLSQTATIAHQILLSENGRVLVEYRRER